jgi:hypothetical protein
MAVSTLSIPSAGLKLPSGWGTRPVMVQVLSKGWKNYGKFFKSVSEMTNVPIQVLMSFAVVESTMNPNASTGDTTGLMQWNRAKGYADAVLTNEFKMGRLNDKEKEVLKRKGVKWDAKGVFQPITASQQLDVELNILIGAIYIGQYMDSIIKGKQLAPFAVDNGQLRIDRIIPPYNTGEGSKFTQEAISKKHATPLQTALNSTGVTKDYINKILGVNGAMDVLTKELKDLIV